MESARISNRMRSVAVYRRLGLLMELMWLMLVDGFGGVLNRGDVRLTMCVRKLLVYYVDFCLEIV